MDSHKILDVPYNADQRTVKRAYAALIKQFRPDSHPTEFARIRVAYEELMERCRYRQQYEEDNAASSLEPDNQEKEPESNDLATNTGVVEVIYNAEYDYYDFQSENFERLVDKPFIQLPETEDSQNLIDPYSRLVDKPFIHQADNSDYAEFDIDLLFDYKPTIEQQTDKIDVDPAIDELELAIKQHFDLLQFDLLIEFDLLVDKPIIEQQTDKIDVDPDIDELEWVIKHPLIDKVDALIEQLLRFQQPNDEHAALACFEAQFSDFALMNIDQLMNYEEKLFNHLLYVDRPALLVFAAASDYFDWKNRIAWLKNAQGKWKKVPQSQWIQQRFDILTKLSTLYRRVCQQYNPYFKHNLKTKIFWLTTRYHHSRAQKQRDEWMLICEQSDFTSLKTYFTDKSQQRCLYIIDIFLGAVLSYLVLLWNEFLVSLEDEPAPNLLMEYYHLVTWGRAVVAIVGGFLWALLLSSLRTAWLFLQELFPNIHKRTLLFMVMSLTVTTAMFNLLWINDIEFIFRLLILNIGLLFLYKFLADSYSWIIQLDTLSARIVDKTTLLSYGKNTYAHAQANISYLWRRITSSWFGLRTVGAFLQAPNYKISNGVKWGRVFVLTALMTILIQFFVEGNGFFIVPFIILLLAIVYPLFLWLIQLASVVGKTVAQINQYLFVQKKVKFKHRGNKQYPITNLNLLLRTRKNTTYPPINVEKATHTMNKQIYPLLIAQFLSAFADNAILFTVIAMVMKSANQTSWYVPALQGAFLIAYVVLGPWVGGIADRHAKARVLLVANIIKAVGAGLLFVNIEPLLAYGIVGVGAAIYSPAKYGILPELVGHDSLVKANSWIEGSTILAILLGMKIGAEVADHSIQLALLGTIVLFIISALATLSLPVNISKNDSNENALLEFGKQMAAFFTTPRSRFSVLGGSLFWAAAASLRVILIAWAPLVLLSKNASEIADLTLYLTVGIIAGSIIVPRLIPLEQLRRARIPAYLMALLIAGLSLTTDAVSAQAVLFAIGTMGGLFIVPINAALQEQGQQTIGSGSAVALQNFFQNLAMLLAVGAYTISAAQHVDPTTAMLTLGGVMFIVAFLVSLCLPDKRGIGSSV
jgi:LPLT family lysophospholipid transporter-like MFS transporter